MKYIQSRVTGTMAKDAGKIGTVKNIILTMTKSGKQVNIYTVIWDGEASESSNAYQSKHLNEVILSAEAKAALQRQIISHLQVSNAAAQQEKSQILKEQQKQQKQQNKSVNQKLRRVLSRVSLAEEQYSVSNTDFSASSVVGEDSAAANKSNYINDDAAKYERALKETLIFYTCGICDREHGLRDCVLLEDIKWELEHSGLAAKCFDMLKPLREPDLHNKYEIAFAYEVEFALFDGILKHAIYACKFCVSELPKRPKQKRTASQQHNCSSFETDHSGDHRMDHNIDHSIDHSIDHTVNDHNNTTFTSAQSNLLLPKLALVNGHFRGRTPQQLANLNRTELSMVSFINVVCTLSMLKPGAHYGSSGTVFSIMNDVHSISANLPRLPSLNEVALMRSADSECPTGFEYSPHKVMSALVWLTENNFLYDNENLLERPPDSVWQGDGDASPIPVPFIEITANDCEDLTTTSASSGADGHPVNPSAPASELSEVMLIPTDDNRDIFHQVAQIIESNNNSSTPAHAPKRVTQRTPGVLVHDFETEYFLQMAFVNLYPFGRGGPDSRTGVKYDASYVTSVLNLGRTRAFQQSPSFIFYAYSRHMKRKCGTLSWLATRNASDEVDSTTQEVFTVRDCTQFLEQFKAGLKSRQAKNKDRSSAAVESLESLISTAQMHKWINRLRPYALELPGTEIYMSVQRRKLLSMISSPATTVHGLWQYFFTECQPDMHLAELFDNAITSSNILITTLGLPWYALDSDKQSHSDLLTKSERARILRDHPYLSARLHGLQQTAFWEFVLNGKHQPLGKIYASWRRVEFQEKGTPHSHCLINIYRDVFGGVSEDSLLDLNNVSAVAPVLEAVQTVATARLQPRDEHDLTELPGDVCEHEYIREQEQSYSYTVDRTTYFDDKTHPCRVRFTAADRDFNYDKTTGEIKDRVVQSLARRMQLANQLHVCRDSCFKYCRKGDKRICRYRFAKVLIAGNFNSAVIVTAQDRRSRTRIIVEPPRNNANLNVCCANPLIVLGCRGNHDIQYIANSHGGAEYVSKYASKTDTMESTALKNAISRRLTTATLMLGPHEQLTLRQRLRSVATAISTSQQVGTVHAVYVLAQSHLLVQSSRNHVFLNAFIRKEITSQPVNINEEELNEMEDMDSALKNSPSTTFGKRDAYFALVRVYIAKGLQCPFDFYAFISAYQVRKESSTPRGVNSKVREGITVPITIDKLTGLIENAYSFTLGVVHYSAYKSNAIVTLSPHIPLRDHTEKSCYALLLLHSKWGIAGEDGLLGGCATAMERYSRIRSLDDQSEEGGGFPEYVKRSLKKRIESETLLADSGTPLVNTTAAPEEDDPDELDRLMADQADEGAESIQFLRQVDPDAPTAPLSNNHGRNVVNCPQSQLAFLGNFVSNMNKKQKEMHKRANKCTEEEEEFRKLTVPSTVIEIDDVDTVRQEVDSQINSLNFEQRVAFDAAAACISGTSPVQLVMFLSGEGGTGKSHVIHTLTKYTQVLKGKTVGWHGSVLKTAPTGGAAYNIKGHTWHSALGKTTLKRLKKKSQLTDAQVLSLQYNLRGVVLFILDEISLLSLEDLYEINFRLCTATGVFDKPFGGIHTILAGDFYQMKTISGTPIVEQTSSIHHAKVEALEAKKIFTEKLTHCVVLTENVRAQSSGTGLSPLARFAKLARVGDVAGSDVLDIMNERVVNSMEVAMRDAHAQALWITSTHRRIQEINEAFLDRLTLNEHTPRTRLIALHVPTKVSVDPPDQKTRDKLYSIGGAAKSASGGMKSHMATYMDLCIGSRVRIVKNISTPCGLYNGAMGTVYGFVYEGRGPQTAAERVPTEFSHLEDNQRELPIVLVRVDGDDASFPYSCSNEVTRLIPIVPIADTQSLAANDDETRVNHKYIRYMLPILPAHARTGHSVQGHTAQEGIVVDVGSMFYAGDYVALSRAKDILDVRLLSPVFERHFTSHYDYRILVHSEYLRLQRAFPQQDTESCTSRPVRPPPTTTPRRTTTVNSSVITLTTTVNKKPSRHAAKVVMDTDKTYNLRKLSPQMRALTAVKK